MKTEFDDQKRLEGTPGSYSCLKLVASVCVNKRIKKTKPYRRLSRGVVACIVVHASRRFGSWRVSWYTRRGGSRSVFRLSRLVFRLSRFSGEAPVSAPHPDVTPLQPVRQRTTGD